jgi:hypothetical protein
MAGQAMEFRCPFEVQGQREGAILEVELPEDKRGRIEALQQALNTFYVATDMVAIRLSLPESVLKRCTSNEDVKERIMPFQAEVIAAEMDLRLYPFMPYQLVEYGRESAQKLVERAPWRFLAAEMLTRFMTKDGIRPPLNADEASIWIEANFEFSLKHGMRTPTIYLWQSDAGDGRLDVVTITPSSLELHADRVKSQDPRQNRNCFSVVKTPFYPKAFGRYSERLEIVLTREADFLRLSPNVRKQIRTRSNAVLRAGGVRISDLEGDKQETGVWVPKYEPAG